MNLSGFLSMSSETYTQHPVEQRIVADQPTMLKKNRLLTRVSQVSQPWKRPQVLSNAEALADQNSSSATISRSPADNKKEGGVSFRPVSRLLKT
jgi:hypothetical protein